MKPFKIMYNTLLIVETNSRPISSVSKWVSISKSVPGDSREPVTHKNDSYCKLRSLQFLVGVGGWRGGRWEYLSTCF